MTYRTPSPLPHCADASSAPKLDRRKALLAAGALAATPFATHAQDASPESGHDHGTPATPVADNATPVPATPFNGLRGEPLREPSVRASENGELVTTFRVARGETTVAGVPARTLTYEGEFPGPTLRLKAGEILRLQLENGLEDITNIHTHGFHVSPSDNSDNIFIEVHPGETFDYEYVLPETHAPGTFWYHPHAHGNTGMQTNAGLSGLIIVEGNLDEVEGIAGLTERVLVLNATQFDGDGNLVPYDDQLNSSVQRFVNGQLEPRISIRPGETQRWRVANVSANNFFNVALAGHQLHEIANDGNPNDRVMTHDSVLLAPAERSEILIQAQTVPGEYELRSLMWGPSHQAEPDVLLATVVIEGEPVDPTPLPSDLVPFENLRGLPVDNVRITTFEEPGAPLFLAIDGKHFDHDRIDQTVKLNALEEWVVRNTTDHWHPFHIHINDFQVLSVNGEALPDLGLQDVVNMPPHSETIIRMRFADYTGKFVYHCHILAHEDYGMMATVEVVP